MKNNNGRIAYDLLENAMKQMNQIRIIDVRMESDIPSIFGVQVENVPSFELEEVIDQWDKSCSYILFCDRGNTSDWAYQLLTYNGFENVYQIENGVIELSI